MLVYRPRRETVPKSFFGGVGTRNEGPVARRASVHLRPAARDTSNYTGPRNPQVKRHLATNTVPVLAEFRAFTKRAFASAEFHRAGDAVTGSPFNSLLASPLTARDRFANPRRACGRSFSEHRRRFEGGQKRQARCSDRLPHRNTLRGISHRAQRVTTIENGRGER